jgi:FkbM family methyltransferase
MFSSIKKKRCVQLPSSTYNYYFSNLLSAYYRAFDHPFKMRIISLVENFIGPKRIVVKTKNGFHLAVDAADLIQRAILFDGIYEPELIDFFSRELSAEDVFYDIGSNVGYFSKFALQKGCQYVVAFEPDPLNCELVKLNASLDHYPGNLVIENFALGNETGRRIFGRAHVANTGVSGFSPCNAVDKFEVDIYPLDSVVSIGRYPPPTVMKVDVEGWEEYVFRGASDLFFSSPPRLVVFETDCDKSGNIKKSWFGNFFNIHGYSIQRLSRLSGLIEDKENYIARYDN